jgi:hypothetical protein
MNQRKDGNEGSAKVIREISNTTPIKDKKNTQCLENT